MQYFVVYDAASGLIAYTAHSDASAEIVAEHWLLSAGQAIAFHAAPIVDQRDWWVDGGAVTPRAAMDLAVANAEIAADGEAEAVISGLPDPCSVHITGAVELGPVAVTGGELRLTSTTAGELRVAISAEPRFVARELVLHAH